MGNRYFITVICPKCEGKEENVYYAPTCGFVDWKCPCGNIVDLEEYTGISYDDASNRDALEQICNILEKQ